MVDRECDRQTSLGISRSLSEAFANRDAHQIASLYADDVTVWHNHTNSSEGKEENLTALAVFFLLFSEVAYRDIRFTWTEEGFVQRHMIAGKLATNGVAVEIPACLVVTVNDGRIVRLDEYGDPAPLMCALHKAST